MAFLFSKLAGLMKGDSKHSRTVHKKILKASRLLESGNSMEAFSLFSALARKGEAEAQWHVGKFYLSGNVVPHSLGEGAFWTKLAADQGFAPACLTLAHLYQEGLPSGFDFSNNYQSFANPAETDRVPDEEKAQFWAEKAAEAGDSNAQAFLGALLRKKSQTEDASQEENANMASKWLQRSVAGGSAVGKLEHARQMLEEAGYFQIGGDAKPPSEVTEIFTKAVTHLEEALKEGANGAALLLAWLRLQGPVAFRKIETAASLLEAAAEKGLSQAQYRLGKLCLENHKGLPADMKKAEKWLKMALRQNIGGAGYLLGQMYESLLPKADQDKSVALRYYHNAALLKDVPSILRLAHLLMEGIPEHNLAPDKKKGAFWLSRAAGLGSQEAQVEFGNLLLHGVSVPEEEGEAWRKGLAQEAEKESHDAAYNLGLSYLDGIGGEKDDVLARKWLAKAAPHFPEAAYQYGKILFEGKGGKADPERAKTFFGIAAKAGLPEAYLALAQMYLMVEEMKNHPRALYFYHRAAEAGSADAMFSLGAMYGGGHDVPVDRIKARKYFLAGAKRGNPLAQLMAGRYCARGFGGERDLKQAYAWFTKAAEKGIREASAHLADMQREVELLRMQKK